jgi:biotin synthase
MTIMCYSIPGKVVEITGRTAIVDYFGEKRKALNELVNVKVGDYIYAQGGFIINVVPEKEALEVLKDWHDIFFALQKTDVRLSRLDMDKTGIDNEISAILDKAAEAKPLSKGELLKLMRIKEKKELNLLFKVANFLRQKYLKNACCIHGIIEFSNYCRNDCEYCGIRNSADIARYRMTDEEIYQAVDDAVDKYGFKALVLQSGEDPEFTVDRLANIIREIKKRHAVLLFISIGEIGKDGLKKLYDAGARGLLMRFETSDRKLYSKLHCGDKLDDRIRDIKDAYGIGYLVLSGGLIGLPGQSEESLLNDILLTKELHAEMFSFGPVLLAPKSNSSGPEGPDTELVLKVLAISRIVDPKNAKIVVTTGFETLDKNARTLGLMAGANSMMLNVTPVKFRKMYNIYPNRAHEEESIEQQIDEAVSLLQKLGRAPTDIGIS